METITVLFCAAGRPPEWKTIENTEEHLLQLVSEYEEYYPFSDEDMAILVRKNAEGLAKNREFLSENSTEPVIIRGDFMVVYAPLGSRSYQNFPDKRMKKIYEDLFSDPERVIRIEETLQETNVKS